MYCPKCGQSQVADEVRFCSRCGLPLGAVTQLVAHDGAWPEYQPPADAARPDSPRRLGLRKGGKMLLVGTFLVPMLAIMCLLAEIDPEFVLLGVLVVIAGILRLLYALIFEDKHPAAAAAAQFAPTAAPAPQFVAAPRRAAALPPQQTPPAPVSFRTRDTGELAGRPSVTESTTRLLDPQNDPREQ
jgi:hypothetical protein